MAAEVGDRDARAKLLDYADRNFNPVWKNGEYFYPRSDDYTPDAKGGSHGVDTWTGNALIALTRLDTGSGFQKLYSKPWGPDHFKEPYVSGVDALHASVTQAWYDAGKQALVVKLVPGPIKSKDMSFTVQQLDPAKRYTLIQDGKVRGRISGDASTQVKADLTAPHVFLLIADQ